jgi:hypothetical protein
MKCPTCPDATLLMTDRSGIEIDYCPTCRGVWLDRGELDKLIERAAVAERPVPAAPLPPPAGDRRDRDDDDDRYRYARPSGGEHYGKPYGKKKKSVLGELFDF